MESLQPIRENCFGWWLADLEEKQQSWSPRIRPLGHFTCTNSRKKIDEPRNQQLISPTSVPSREELFQLIQSGRLRHLEQHQTIIETVLGPKPQVEKPAKDKSVSTRTPSTPSPIDVNDDLRMMKAIDDAVRNGYVDQDLAQQVSRVQELRKNLTELRSTSWALHRDLQALDTTATNILSSVRSMRQDVADLYFLEKLLAAAEGVLLSSPSCNLII